MSFRKDELILPEDSDDENTETPMENIKQKKDVPGVEDAFELVDYIEDKMVKMSQVIKGMDKRMSYNLRLIGSAVMDNTGE